MPSSGGNPQTITIVLFRPSAALAAPEDRKIEPNWPY